MIDRKMLERAIGPGRCNRHHAPGEAIPNRHLPSRGRARGTVRETFWNNMEQWVARKTVGAEALNLRENLKTSRFLEENLRQAGAGFEPATNGFAIRPISPLWHPAEE